MAQNRANLRNLMVLGLTVGVTKPSATLTADLSAFDAASRSLRGRFVAYLSPNCCMSGWRDLMKPSTDWVGRKGVCSGVH